MPKKAAPKTFDELFPDKVPCFAYESTKMGCTALSVKRCEGMEKCRFYKPKTQYERESIESMERKKVLDSPKFVRDMTPVGGDMSGIDF